MPPKKRKGCGARRQGERATARAERRFARVHKKKTAPAPRVPRKKPAEEPHPSWLECVRAAESRKALGIRVLDLRPLTSFADFFVLCNGANQRQIQAICDEVLRVMKLRGERPISLEGYDNAEWVLMDFGDLLVHIFSEKARVYYDLDRLWRDAPRVEIPPERTEVSAS